MFSIRAIVNMIFFWALLDTWKHLWLSLPVYALGIVSLIVLAARRLPVETLALRALAGLVLGTAVSGFVMFPHFTGYFVKLAFPFLLPILLLALAICVASIWRLCAHVSRPLAYAALCAMLALWGVEQWQGFMAAAPEVTRTRST